MGKCALTTQRGKEDDYGFTLVNFSRLLFNGNQLSDEPFILATQAKQVFYVQDPIEKEWQIVVHTKPRDFFDMQGDILTDDIEFQVDNDIPKNIINEIEEEFSWNRNDVPELTIDTPMINTFNFQVNSHEDTQFEEDND